MQDLITEEQNSFIRTCKDGWGDLTYIWQMPAECKMYPTPLGLSVLHGGTSLSCPSSPSKESFRLKKKKVLVYLFPLLEVFTDRNYSSLPRDNIHVYVSFLVIIRMLFGLKIQGADIQNWICKVAMQSGLVQTSTASKNPNPILPQHFVPASGSWPSLKEQKQPVAACQARLGK